MIQFLATSKALHPVWRTFPELEAAFFAYCKQQQRGSARPAAFGELMGVDVSYYQGAINYQVVKDYGARFVIPRAGYNIYKDSRYDEYMAGFRNLLPLSSYVFYHPETNPITQAEKMLTYLAPHKAYVHRVWGDMEYTWTGAYDAPKHWKAYRDTIKAEGYKWGWYTRKTWWDTRVTAAEAAEFAVDPVWAAQYSSALTLIPKGWTSAAIWQRGALPIGIDAGVSSPNLDVNYWNTEYNFAAEWGAVEVPPTNGGTMKKGTLTASTTVLNVRNAPVSGSIISTIKTGDTVYGEIDTASGWLKVSSITRATGAVETFTTAYCSTNPLYITLTDYTPPAPVAETVDVQLPAGSVVIFKDANGVEIARYTA
mgnify:CR=1 FL=1